MGWGQKNARFYCEVHSARKEKEVILGDATSGLYVCVAGEHGAIIVNLTARGQERDPKGRWLKNDDSFHVQFCPWRRSENEVAAAITLARGRLDYDACRQGETVVRLDDEVMEAFRIVRAKEILAE